MNILSFLIFLSVYSLQEHTSEDIQVDKVCLGSLCLKKKEIYMDSLLGIIG